MPRRYLALLLLWLAPQVHAEALYRVELILFRHATPLQASQHAPYDWARQARPLEPRAERQPALEHIAARLTPEQGYQVLLHRAWQQPVSDDGPAIEYVHPDHRGRLGLIAPYAPGFCDGCNRLRVTAAGKLRLCLFGQDGVDLRDLLQDGDSAALEARIESALALKPRGHRLAEDRFGDTRNLAQLGG